MRDKTCTDHTRLNGFRAAIEINSRMTLSADIIKEWAKDDLKDLDALVSAPRFPLPTKGMAELPLHQREWPAAEVWIFKYRKSRLTVLIDTEQPEDASTSHTIKFDITNPS